MIEDLPEEHTPNRALPQWAIDRLLFGVPKYASAPKIWGRMVSIAVSAYPGVSYVPTCGHRIGCYTV